MASAEKKIAGATMSFVAVTNLISVVTIHIVIVDMDSPIILVCCRYINKRFCDAANSFSP